MHINAMHIPAFLLIIKLPHTTILSTTQPKLQDTHHAIPTQYLSSREEEQ